MPTNLATEDVERSVRDGGKWTRQQFLCPLPIRQYNSCMGGVDLADMRTTAYDRLMKGWTWYLKLFFQLLDVCVLNSFIQYQMWPNSKGKDENMMIFRSDVIKGLHGGRSHQKDGRYQEPVLAVPCRFDSSLRHHPGKIAQLRECKVHIQGMLTPYTCAVCNVSM